MERLLHYIWKYKLYDPASLTTTDGIPLHIIDVGIHNNDAGPDFFNAKIKVRDTVWAGCVEIHDKASDWLQHGHQEDRAYDAVILHVTGKNDADIFRTNGEPVPQLVLTVPESVRKNIDWLLHQDKKAIACLAFLPEVDPVFLASWMAALLEERLERKTEAIFQLLEQYNNDWNEVFYISLTRSFGFGINGDAFEWLAKSLPFQYIRKQRNSHSQVEALLFGQAGMLDAPGNCDYYRLLQREYHFFQKKYGLRPLDGSLFKNLRVRPGNFPYERLAQLAALWVRYDTLFSNLLEAGTPRALKDHFRISPSDYWKTHYHFRYASPEKEKRIGENSLNILLINTVVPMFFAYGEQHHLPQYNERALRLLEILPAEKNSIVQIFQQAGVPVHHAGDSQALIQLKRAYCESKKCLYCRIGYSFLKRITSPQE
ncbi:hypothetical protein M2480_001715 [Parabacteroides sp. PFB2-12]|uniref:DUF2851 family protein n=1 Tax=unclassified Parabacteroides TaxID=2649774 RepID=UPI0024750939|nr:MULTISPECIES: DUF2851 family protein [unclassified Parabacteroides]MDH6343088.1 hypothetical protein [Parabacteroides sp. PM6-13]MDH6390733.1 hypothetical protein [Parabacteroides sp. PFB2-12]